jgi:hypothetical protein
MTFRLTMFFAARKAGWTESFFSAAASHSAALIDLKALAAVRKELLGVQGRLEFLRVSDVNQQRDALIEALFGDDARSLAAAANQANSDDPSEGVLYRFVIDPFRWRSSYVRGIWDDVVRESADPTLPYPAGWNAKYAAWKAVMINGKYQIRYKDQTATKFRVLSLGPWGAVVTRTQVQTFLAHGLVRGDKVQLLMRKPGTFRRFVKIWEVLDAPTPDTFIIETAAPVVAQIPQNMFAQKVTYAFQAITDLIFERYGKKKVGRPFGSPRGKLSARPLVL